MKNEVKSTTATVQVTLEISALSSWGEECPISQVHRQATEEAIGRISRLVGNDRAIRIVDVPKVSAVVLTKDDRK